MSALQVAFGSTLHKVSVIGAPINVIRWQEALNTIETWSRARESRYVCICNAHSCVTAGDDEAFGVVVREADLATPDGAPVAWMLRRLGYPDQQRINGPDLMLRYCAAAAARGESIFLYGATPGVLAKLKRNLEERFPGLLVAGMISPPFRPLTEEEDAQIVAEINGSGAGTVWVGLGCPKQEKWMAAHRGRIRAVMIGVGAAFDYHAGAIARAPEWMQRNGLEWLHRFLSEPRRLARRYFVTNTLFIVRSARQMLAR